MADVSIPGCWSTFRSFDDAERWCRENPLAGKRPGLVVGDLLVKVSGEKFQVFRYDHTYVAYRFECSYDMDEADKLRRALEAEKLNFQRRMNRENEAVRLLTDMKTAFDGQFVAL